MSIYGQFCPIARTAEVLGERWTLLIIRELLMGSSRFNELQRGMSKISPSLLSKRLQELEAANIIYRKKIDGQKGYAYFLTQSGLALEPLVMELAKWGMNWVEEQLSDDELDLELLMFDINRNLHKDKFPDTLTTLKFFFKDVDKLKDWWILVTPQDTDLCTKDPGKEPDVYITTCRRSLTEVWMGQQSWQNAIRQKEINIMGETGLARQIPAWLGTSVTVALKT